MQIEIAPRKCCRHSRPLDSICLSGICNTEILLCDQCLKEKHPHFNMPLTEFKTMFNQKVAEKRSKLQSINYDETPIASISKQYKTDIEEEQLKLIEGIMKQLGDDKKVILEQLTGASSAFCSRYQKQLKKVEGLKTVKDYDPATLLLKIKMSNADRVTAIRDAYLSLTRLSDEQLLVLKEEKALKGKLSKYVKQKNLNSFVQKLKETVTFKKSQVKATPVKPRPRNQSTERGRRGIFDRRRSSDQLAPSPKPGIRG